MSHVNSIVPSRFNLAHSDLIPQNATVTKILLVLFQCLLRDLAENTHLRRDQMKDMRERAKRKRKRRGKKKGALMT